MKAYISADLEGVAGVVGEPGISLMPGSLQYEFARKELTLEVNSAIEGLRQSGFDEILVDDEHNGGTEILIYDELLEGVKIFLGSPRPRRFPAMDNTYNAMLLIGYHPMAGTIDGILSHTYSTGEIQRMWLNGREIGEIGLDAALAGIFGIPVIFVSSCRKGIEEARQFLGNIETVEVKQGYGRNCALSLHPKDAQKLIEEKVILACSRFKEFSPMKISSPYTLKTEYKSETSADVVSKKPGAMRLDAKTVTFTSDNLFELI